MSDTKGPPKPWKEWRAEARNRWTWPFLWTEWACEHLALRLSCWAFIQVLEYIGKLSLIGALIVFIWGIPARREAAEDARKSKHYQAWQTINTAYSKPGDGGRCYALQDLSRDGVSLAAVNISEAYLIDLVLTNASLPHAILTNGVYARPNFRHSFLYKAQLNNSYFKQGNFEIANLQEANLSTSYFRNSNFKRSNIQGGNFSHAYLARANFSEAYLLEADFYDAVLPRADLSGARLIKSNLRETDFTRAHLHGAILQGANLHGTDFEEAFLVDADFNAVTNWMTVTNLSRANIFGLKNSPVGFVEWATNKMGALSFPVENYHAWTNWLGPSRDDRE